MKYKRCLNRALLHELEWALRLMSNDYMMLKIRTMIVDINALLLLRLIISLLSQLICLR